MLMVGENGTPETPDWSIQHVVRVSAATYNRLVADDDDTPPANLVHLARRMRADDLDIPSNIILGTE